jgi:shikimate kinase
MSRLIIIRGNSGSGKTTIAKQLQQDLQPRFVKDLGHGTMLVQQDVVRREILRVSDIPENPAIKLIEEMVLFGEESGYDVILEGILNKNVYGDMLTRLMTHFKGRIQTYYFDISFEETLHRHATKPNAHEYGEEQMREWYKEKDILGLPDEKLFTDNQSEEEIFQSIMQDLQ